MKLENKEILIKDLCARIPYGVQVSINNTYIEELVKISQNGYCQTFLSDKWYEIEEIKPYLFPLSSMTEKQKEEIFKVSPLTTFLNDTLILKVMDWLNKHHFDYRGLIDKGLAIDATNLNIY